MMNMKTNFLIAFICMAVLHVSPAISGIVVTEGDDAKLMPEIVQVAETSTSTPTRPPVSLARAKQARKNPSVDEIDAITAAESKKRKKYVMRCWQNGQLILERHMDDLPPDSSKTVALDNGRGMRLFDLRNAACLMQ
jgi:hypothetical protein